MNEDDTLTTTYVTFRLGEESYALGIEQVREVLVYAPVTTRVPRTRPSMRGVMNLRGNILPVIDFNERLHGHPTVVGRDTCILVLEVEEDGKKVLVGALADAVEEVLRLPPEARLPPPRGGTSCRIDLLDGLAHRGEDLVMILKLARVLDDPPSTPPAETSEPAPAQP